jgi:hypothetical protein
LAEKYSADFLLESFVTAYYVDEERCFDTIFVVFRETVKDLTQTPLYFYGSIEA